MPKTSPPWSVPWLLLLSLLLAGCTAQAGFTPRLHRRLPLPQGVELAFNHDTLERYRSPTSGRWREGSNLEALIIDTIRRARREVVVAVQELSLPAIAEALVERQRAGVTVRVVVENTYRQPWGGLHASELDIHGRDRLAQLTALADHDRDGRLSSEERFRGDAMALLEASGVPLRDDTSDGSRGSGLMHHKFLVVDGRWVVTGSANFSSSDIHGDGDGGRTSGNANHLFRFDSTALAGLFRGEFERLWTGHFGRDKGEGSARRVQLGAAEVEVLFAPHGDDDPANGLALIGERLGSARRGIDMALFVFSAQPLADVLADRARSGVKIRALVDPGFAYRSYSELLDLMGVTLPDQRCRLEQSNRPWGQPLASVGIPKLARGDKLHHKLAVVDGSTVISGSFNWSPAAATTNDETLLIVHAPAVAAEVEREMQRLWRGASLGVTPRLARKLQQGRQRCGRGLEVSTPPPSGRAASARLPLPASLP
ncbi:MAG: phospholipase D-like domain-containing protein [Synechococcus sp.]